MAPAALSLAVSLDANASSQKNTKISGAPVNAKLTHETLNKILGVALVLAAFKFSNPAGLPKKFIAWIKGFPDIYTPQFDWINKPMDKFVAVSVWIAGVYFLLKTYVIKNSREVVDRAHKKYVAHKNMWAVILHGVGSALEMSVGCLACCRPDKPVYTKIATALAINNVATGFVLTPGVFGIKHLTVPGFYLFGVLRCLEIIRTLFADYRNYPQAWVLLQVGTIVRLLGYFVLPFSSTDGVRGDLFTEPSIYSFNILLSGYLTAAFVYPPKWVLASLALYPYWMTKQPYRISMRRRPRHEFADESYRTNAGHHDSAKAQLSTVAP